MFWYSWAVKSALHWGLCSGRYTKLCLRVSVIPATCCVCVGVGWTNRKAFVCFVFVCVHEHVCVALHAWEWLWSCQLLIVVCDIVVLKWALLHLWWLECACACTLCIVGILTCFTPPRFALTVVRTCPCMHNYYNGYPHYWTIILYNSIPEIHVSCCSVSFVRLFAYVYLV